MPPIAIAASDPAARVSVTTARITIISAAVSPASSTSAENSPTWSGCVTPSPCAVPNSARSDSKARIAPAIWVPQCGATSVVGKWRPTANPAPPLGRSGHRLGGAAAPQTSPLPDGGDPAPEAKPRSAERRDEEPDGPVGPNEHAIAAHSVASAISAEQSIARPGRSVNIAPPRVARSSTRRPAGRRRPAPSSSLRMPRRARTPARRGMARSPSPRQPREQAT